MKWKHPQCVLLTLATVLICGCAQDLVVDPKPAGTVTPELVWQHNVFASANLQRFEDFLSSRQEETTSLLNGSQRDSANGQIVKSIVESLKRPRVRTQLTQDHQVDEAGVIRSAITEVSLFASQPNIWAGMESTVVAVLSNNISGSVTSNGWNFPVSSSQTTTPFITTGFSSTVHLNEVSCAQAPASATAATEHTAGWHVRGIGWVPGHARSSDYESCPGPTTPCEVDCGGGTGGGGGAGGGTPPEGQQRYCLVEWWYDTSTGQIYKSEILYCWNA